MRHLIPSSRYLLAIIPLICILTAACGSNTALETSTAEQAGNASAIVAQTSPGLNATVTLALPGSITPTARPAPTTPAPPTPAPPASTPTTSRTVYANTEPVLPEEHYIQTISGHRQFFTLGCETSAAVDWAIYFGVEINEFEFQYKIPLSDNPDYGFVGNVRDPWGQTPPYSYGVHADPIAQLLSNYGVPALGLKGSTLEQIQSEITADRPVIAWVIGNVVGGIPAEYIDSQGRSTIVAAYEHVIILTGYNAERIRYLNNGRFYDVPNAVFLNSWGVLGNMVIIRGEELTPTPLSEQF